MIVLYTSGTTVVVSASFIQSSQYDSITIYTQHYLHLPIYLLTYDHSQTIGLQLEGSRVDGQLLRLLYDKGKLVGLASGTFSRKGEVLELE